MPLCMNLFTQRLAHRATVKEGTLKFEPVKSFVSQYKLMSVSREYSSNNSDIFKLVCEYIQLGSIYRVFLGVAGLKIVKS